uniref:Coiled-coil domain containing 96 n=1 Tax=Sinocyclocheilus anshuiensis TaxID=1608454 RepID=A0A671NWE7_9TELE
MEEGSLELKHEESLVLENNTLVENTELSEDLTKAASARVGEEETEMTEPPSISEGVEDDVVKQGSQLAEDMSIAETSEAQIAETEFGHHMITEREDGIEPLINETLEDTEGPEIGHFIDDLLSREDTEGEEEEDRIPAPDPESERIIGAAEEEEMGFNISDEEHMDLLHELQAEKLSKLNGLMQTKIVEYLSKKTGDKHPRLEGDISYQEQYQKYMVLLEDLKMQHHSFSEHRKTSWHLCLNNIKFKNKMCRLETELKSKRELADGLLLMDFEQLKTENQTFKDKLKKRSEKPLRLKRKVACSVQGISHVKEKLYFMQMENKVKHTQLAKADTLVAHKCEVLTRTRQARDGLHADNLKLQQRCGLLGNTTLLQDFEEKCAGVKQKIEQSKPEGQ